MKNQVAAIIVSALLLGGCGMTMGPAFQAGANKPERGRALVYVYRNKTFIGIANADVPIMHLDGRRIGRIRISGHLAIPVSPGTHTLTTTESLLGGDTSRVRGQTTFTVAAGSTVYLRYTERIASMTPIITPVVTVIHTTGEYRFEAVPETEALKELADTTVLDVER